MRSLQSASEVGVVVSTKASNMVWTLLYGILYGVVRAGLESCGLMQCKGFAYGYTLWSIGFVSR